MVHFLFLVLVDLSEDQLVLRIQFRLICEVQSFPELCQLLLQHYFIHCRYFVFYFFLDFVPELLLRNLIPTLRQLDHFVEYFFIDLLFLLLLLQLG